jgi:vancomycin permeability regulator SanA
MNEKIKQLLLQGENLSTEYKECVNNISPTVYETVCAF